MQGDCGSDKLVMLRITMCNRGIRVDLPVIKRLRRNTRRQFKNRITMHDDERALFVVCLLLLHPIGDFGDGELHERPGACRDLSMLRGDLLAKHRMQAAAREACR